MEARLSAEKLQCTWDLLHSFTTCRSVRLVELQSLISTLQFACKAVVPWRMFLQHMINFTQLFSPHPVEQRMEWALFFLDTTVTPSPDLELYTDASGSVSFGGYFNGPWFQGTRPPHMHLNRARGITIEWQKLFPIVVACAFWFFHFPGKCIQMWCENESVVANINLGHSKALRIMDLLRFLIIISMKHNFFIRACRIPGVSNEIADALSCRTPVSGQRLRRPRKPFAPSRLHSLPSKRTVCIAPEENASSNFAL